MKKTLFFIYRTRMNKWLTFALLSKSVSYIKSNVVISKILYNIETLANLGIAVVLIFEPE